ncbi:hypothetical protein HPB52_018211 [Rhipicephalus sanguineus]|uniref:Uncharacterized protein n=1 Tax=Rhipicephalus sanguineus TaxID=34632 RepID=A0A9D4PK65_RHISA|nr:hypothetical protein HPB52_018211 [Rhipicephalus sanguineus]
MLLWFTIAGLAFAVTLLIRYYNGDVPFLLVKDLDFLEYAYIKNFKNFTARGETTKMIELRKAHPELRKPDILQSLLDAELEEETLSEAVTKGGTRQTANGLKKKVRALSPKEVIMNATLLFMGG